jgi:hypothetical protein
MENEEYYWKMKNGKKINVNNMTEEHLRNVLKMIIRNKKENELRGDEPIESNTEPYSKDYLWKD